jgi:DNA-binding beta-propeller fold protein YncE
MSVTSSFGVNDVEGVSVDVVNNRLYLGNGAVNVRDLTTLAPIMTIAGVYGHGFDIYYPLNQLYVTAAGAIKVINLSTLNVVDSIPIPIFGSGVAYNPVNQRLYYCSYVENSLYALTKVLY